MNGVESRVPMKPGGNGFVQGVFPDETCSLEASNLLLVHLKGVKSGGSKPEHSALKRPAAAQVNKKPAARAPAPVKDVSESGDEYPEEKDDAAKMDAPGGGAPPAEPAAPPEPVFKMPKSKQAASACVQSFLQPVGLRPWWVCN